MTKKKNFKPIKMREIVTKKYPPVEWIINELIPTESVVYISAYPKTYKTWLMLAMAISISNEKLFLNKFKTKKSKVLFVEEESGGRMLQKRLKALTDEKDLEVEFLSYSNCKFSDTEEIVEYCKDNSIEVVFMDSFVRFHSGDENSSRDMAKLYDYIKIFKKCGLTVIISHHTRKSESKKSDPVKDMRGSSEIFAAIDCGLAIKKGDGNDIYIHQTKLRIEEERVPFVVEVVREGDKTKFEYIDDLEEKERASKTGNAKMKILSLLQKEKELFRKEIFERLIDNNCSGYSIKTALTELEEKGKIQNIKTGKGNASLIKSIP